MNTSGSVRSSRQGMKVTMGVVLSGGKQVIVERLPECDLCGNGTLAQFDAKLSVTLYAGVWANVCERHFELSECSLGIGKGQRFVVRGAYATEPRTR